FQDSFEINAALSAVSTALTSLQNQASTYASQVSVLQARQDFTSQQINTLTNGINNLTLADSNLVGAQLLALQTRQTLSSTALSLAPQSDKKLWRLFGKAARQRPKTDGGAQAPPFFFAAPRRTRPRQRQAPPAGGQDVMALRGIGRAGPRYAQAVLST